jgi:hypothetical protein
MQLIAWAGFVLGAFGCARYQQLDLDGVPVLTLDDLRVDPDAFTNVLAAGHSGAVVSIAAGEKLPVRVALHSPLIDLEAGDSSLRFDRDAFLYVTRTMIMASPDRERWARIGDSRSLRQLFGVGQGSLEVGFGVHRSRGPLLSISLAKRRAPTR